MEKAYTKFALTDPNGEKLEMELLLDNFNGRRRYFIRISPTDTSSAVSARDAFQEYYAYQRDERSRPGPNGVLAFEPRRSASSEQQACREDLKNSIQSLTLPGWTVEPMPPTEEVSVTFTRGEGLRRTCG